MAHDDKVRKILSEFNNTKGKVVLNKKTSHLFRDLEKVHQKLDVTGFTDILSISEDGIADVEGMINMEQLASETLKKGFVPQVVIDLKTITAGGAVSGIAIESSSFKYGLFHETIEEMEVLSPTGEIIVCSRDKNSDLFYALPNSYGTLGYILRLKIRLIKAKKFVKLQYLHYSDVKKCMDDIEKFSSKTAEHDFIDAVVFGKDKIVIALGTFTDTAPYVSDYTFMKIYYKSLESRTEEYLTTMGYLFRWDTDLWWGSQNTPLRHRLIRFLVGKWALNSRSYLKFTRLGQKYKILYKLFLINSEDENVIQDIGIPRENWKKFFEFVLSDIKMLPIWLCPFKGNSSFTLFPIENKVYLDFGIWGGVPTKGKDLQWNRLIEKKTFEMKGIKSLYSEVFYTEEEFWKNSDKKAYEKVKSKYDPNKRLKSLYEKVTNN